MFGNKIIKSEMKLKCKNNKNTKSWARGCETEKEGVRSKNKSAQPKSLSSSSNTVKNVRSEFKQLTPAFVIFCKNSKHETCRASNRDSNHIKNLI